MSPDSFAMWVASERRICLEVVKLVWDQVSLMLSLSTQAKEFAMTATYA
jgi:hypothetical protein